MSDKRLSDREKTDAKDSNLRPELSRERTETIDLASLFTTDVSTTGSFDIREKIWATTFGKLIQALPIPVFLIDAAHKVLQANQACAKISPEYETMLGAPFCGFFRPSRSYEQVRSLLEEIFATRKTRVVEAVLSVGERQVWARITFRSLRIMEDRIVLALIEDLTKEKTQL
jgi:PAS domain-containing protein